MYYKQYLNITLGNILYMKKIVKIEMTEKTLEDFEYIRNFYGMEISTEVLRLSITVTAKLLRENTLLDDKRSVIPDAR